MTGLRWNVIFLMFIIIGCNSKANYFDFGLLEDQKYTNPYFNCELNIPEGWAAQANGEQVWQREEGYFDLASGSIDEDIKADVRDVEDVVLLVIMEIELEEGSIPASITFMSESLIYNEEVKDARAYLDFSKAEIIEMGSFKFSDKKMETIQANGADFLVMDAILDVDDRIIYQSFASLVKKDFALSAILTHSSQKQRDMMIEIIKSMDFYD